MGERVYVGIYRRWVSVIGVADDVRHLGLDRPSPPHLYLALDQYPFPEEYHFFLRSRERSAAGLAAAAQKEIEGLDRAQPVYGILPLGATVERWLYRYDVTGRLLGVLAALALTLSLVGISGVVSYEVRRERHGMAVKIALGATRRQVRNAAVRRAMGPVLTALTLGPGVAFGVLSWMSGLLPGLAPFEPAIYGAAAVLLGTTAWAAGYLPARCITELEPADVLRAE